jgi:hypothetical protein
LVKLDDDPQGRYHTSHDFDKQNPKNNNDDANDEVI